MATREIKSGGYDSLFRTPSHKMLFEILEPDLNEDESLEAVRRLMFMSEDEVLKLIKTFPEGTPKVVKNMGGIVSLNQLTRPLGMM